MGLLIGAVNWLALRLAMSLCLPLPYPPTLSQSFSLSIARPLSVFNYNWGDLGLRLSTDIRVRVAHRQPIVQATEQSTLNAVYAEDPSLKSEHWTPITERNRRQLQLSVCAARFWPAWPIKDQAMRAYDWRSQSINSIYRLPYLKLVKLIEQSLSWSLNLREILHNVGNTEDVMWAEWVGQWLNF